MGYSAFYAITGGGVEVVSGSGKGRVCRSGVDWVICWYSLVVVCMIAGITAKYNLKFRVLRGSLGRESGKLSDSSRYTYYSIEIT